MCGISGWFVRENIAWRPDKPFICRLIEGIRMRGIDATGYGTLLDNDEGLYIYKGALLPGKFIEDIKKKEDLPIGRVGLVHTRGANVGSPKNNQNNHPLSYDGVNQSVIVTHNGTIGNLDKAYAALGMKPFAEVDSALIPAALAVLGPKDGMEFLQKESCGSAAFAALFNNGEMILARDTSPLYIAAPQPGVLLWSSEIDPMKEMSEHASEFGLPIWRIWGVADSQYWHWTSDGQVISKGKFRLRPLFAPPDFLRWEKKDWVKKEEPKADFEKVVTEFQKHFNAGAEKKLPMEKGTAIPCNWSGCWKRSVFRVYWNGERWIPLCEKHTNKWEKKGKSLVLSSTHEMGRKIASIAGVYSGL